MENISPELTLGPGFKGFPFTAEPCTATEIAARGWNVLAGDLPFPVAVLKRTALEHNIAWMQDYVGRKGVQLAPHGKTTMSPELFAAQMVAGAWGLTFATAYQVSVGVASGARRIIVANQVVCDADLDALDHMLAGNQGLRIWFLVDSVAQLALIEDWAQRRASSRVFEVLLEMGIPGKRTGCRSFDEAMLVAQAISQSRVATLAGVECYEGNAANCDNEHDIREVSALVRRVLNVALACDQRRLWSDDDDHLLFTAGGSAVFDLVMPLLQAKGLSRPVRGVLRSGCYITHDHLNYARYLANVERREGLDPSLRPALTVWAMVQSVPEPGLALLTCGRRDISFDIEMPVPVRWARSGERSAQNAPGSWRVTALNDQHAYLNFDAEQHSLAPQVGDRIELGISHPCTTFDKWRWMPIVEDDGRVSGAIHTRF
ncbi:amino acid deaminase [Diaphorobacter aerolatus]|uniref:Amino acid deaminase n=1 Tax=Diaphorobacter aerolatus TaxID=1288495 RepID=A0A7H0GQL0_9BURK|nr:amino acid deaminase [Diaphorobacter aerolatus]QNP50576.1 amino acid deaminase [Diaphorobacter aerolatus]